MGFADALAVADRHVVEGVGAPISYTPEGGATVTPTGIFDAVYSPINAGNHANVAGSHPAAFFMLEDLPVDPEIDNPTLVIGAPAELSVRGAYQVTEVHKDGMGGVLLVLQRAP